MDSYLIQKKFEGFQRSSVWSKAEVHARKKLGKVTSPGPGPILRNLSLVPKTSVLVYWTVQQDKLWAALKGGGEPYPFEYSFAIVDSLLCLPVTHYLRTLAHFVESLFICVFSNFGTDHTSR